MDGDQPFGLDGGIQDGSYRIAQGEACLYVSGFGMAVDYVLIMANKFLLHGVCDSQWVVQSDL